MRRDRFYTKLTNVVMTRNPTHPASVRLIGISGRCLQSVAVLEIKIRNHGKWSGDLRVCAFIKKESRADMIKSATEKPV